MHFSRLSAFSVVRYYPVGCPRPRTTVHAERYHCFLQYIHFLLVDLFDLFLLIPLLLFLPFDLFLFLLLLDVDNSAISLSLALYFLDSSSKLENKSSRARLY